MRVEDQIKSYTHQIDATQHAVSVDEALARVDTIRIEDESALVRPTYTRRQRLAGVGAIAAVFVLLFATGLWFGREVLPTEDPAATVTSVPTTVAPSAGAPEQRIDTPIGTWVWKQIEAPLAGVTEYDGMFYSVDSPRPFDAYGNPVNPEELDGPRHLLFSTDGVEWDQRTLPEEMSGLQLGIHERDGMLIIIGQWQPYSSQSYRAWSSEDGITWTDLPGYPYLNRLGLTVPGVTVRGATVLVRHEDPVQVGDVQLVNGSVIIRFPDDVTAAVEGTWGNQVNLTEGDDIRFLIWTDPGEGFIEPDLENPDVEVVVVTNETPDGGLILDYTFWNGLESSGDLLHTARVEIDGALDVDQMTPDALLQPSFEVMWRSEGTDGLGIVPIPVERATLPHPYGQRIEHLTTIDGQFVLYGGAPGGPTTKVNEYVTRAEPSRIGVIATSTDGLAWRTTPIEDLVNPQSVSIADGAPTIWRGEFATWISDNGLTGDITERQFDNWITHGPAGTFMLMNDSSLRLSQDAETWYSIPLPVRSNQQGLMVTATGSRFFYSSGGTGFDWVGYLEP